jgi:hypothetical protein
MFLPDSIGILDSDIRKMQKSIWGRTHPYTNDDGTRLLQ